MFLIHQCRDDAGRLEVAMQKLHALDFVANRTFSDDASLVVSIMRQVADSFVAASIYRPFAGPGRIAATEDIEATFIRARSIQPMPRNPMDISTARIDRLLNESSFGICTPTGSGKTLVANLALIRELLLNRNDELASPLALYIVPSRALAGEVEAKLTSELGGTLSSPDSMAVPIGYYGLLADNRRTRRPHCHRRKGRSAYAPSRPLLTARLRPLIADEAHQVVPDTDEATKVSVFLDHSNRSIRLEGLVSRIFAQRHPDVVRIALTPLRAGRAGRSPNGSKGAPRRCPLACAIEAPAR